MLIAPDKPLVEHIRPLPSERLEGDLIQPGHPLFGVIWINKERMSGEPCFYASRVPVSSVFYYLARGHTIDEFLSSFEGISKEQVEAVLRLAGEGLLDVLPKP